jgi:1-acyl-sn-glycerol-3-phosphate acyltransferase
MAEPAAGGIRPSSWIFRGFRAYARRYVARHFHALRVSRQGFVPELPPEPVIFVMNHPSWWDPMIGLVLTAWMPACRVHRAPIDATGLAQYRFLERLGFFGVEVGTTRGSLAFLRQSLAILADPASALWITSQGTFVDPRDRPVRLKEGIGHLASRLVRGSIVPLAVEYPFWNDRCPEALACFGSPIRIASSGRPLSPREWTALIEHALEETQNRLAEEARSRDPSQFVTLVGGTAGVGGVYDAWRRIRAGLRGESFHASHQTTRHSHP